MSAVVKDFSSYSESVALSLDSIYAQKVLEKQSSILIKPNLVNDSPHPVTTSVECCEAVVEYVRSCSEADIIIAEGCGDAVLETHQVFQALGYGELSKRKGIVLVDLNKAKLRRLEDATCSVFPEIYLPEIAFTHFIISLPVLKAHSLSIITGTLKNMIGFAPPKYYSGKYGIWKKSVFHGNMQQSIIDLNRYRTPDLSLLDASVGLSEYHLGGQQCSPPLKKMIAGFNPSEVDREGAKLLGLNWKEIPHLAVKIQSLSPL